MFVVVVVVFAAVTVVVVAVAVVVLAVAVVVVVLAVAVRCRLLLFLLTLRSISGFRFFRSCFYDSLIANALPVPCYNRFIFRCFRGCFLGSVFVSVFDRLLAIWILFGSVRGSFFSVFSYRVFYWFSDDSGGHFGSILAPF